MKAPMLSIRMRVVLGATLGVALIGVLGFLSTGSRGADFAAINKVIADLRELEALDAEWTAQSLRAKTGLDRAYPAGQSPAERIASGLPAVARAIDALASPESAGEFAEARKLLARKAELTRQFAEQNRTLRESLVYVTDESADMLALLRVQQRELTGRQAAQVAAQERLRQLGVRTSELLTELLKYNLLSDPAAARRIGVNLDDLTAGLDAYPDQVAGQLRQLIAKVRAVQALKEGGDRLLAEMSALPISKQLADTVQAIENGRKEALARAGANQSLLAGYAAFLLGLIAWVSWRLVHSWKLIRHQNAQLEEANDGLEKRVAARTAELSDALSHLKESEAALIQSEKMSSLGQMIAGVAHEINTPLAYVRSGLQVLQEHVPQTAGLPAATRELLDLLARGDAREDEIAAQYARVAALCEAAAAYGQSDIESLVADGLHGIEQIAEIVTNLKNFSRLDRSKVAHFSLCEGLDSTLVIARNLVKAKRIEKDYDQRAFVTGSPSQINQVFLNLITNAAQATGEDGVIRLVTRLEEGSAVVEVADNGSGIPADVLPRIFDPFFTTKQIGEGTGLGLSIAYKIVQEHGGRIEVASQPGSGTRFRIVLPLEPTDAITSSHRVEAAHA